MLIKFKVVNVTNAKAYKNNGIYALYCGFLVKCSCFYYNLFLELVIWYQRLCYKATEKGENKND